nr:MFS transporter [Sulfobacillus thermosulfidooxidans]
MAMADLLSMVTVLMVFALLRSSWVLAPLFVLGVFRAITRPMAQTLVPRLSAQSSHLGRLTADLQTANTLSMVIGFALAGFSVVVHSVQWALGMDAISFLLSACIEVFIQVPVVSLHREARRYGRELLMGWRWMAGSRLLKSLILFNTIAFGLEIGFNNQLVVLIHQHSANSLYYVLTEFAMSIGILVASTTLRGSRFADGERRGRLQLWLGATLILGLCYMAADVVSPLVAVIAFLFVSSLADGASVVAQNHLMHLEVMDEHRNQVYTLRFVMRNLGKAIASILMGVAIAALGLHLVLLWIGLLIAIVAAGIAIYIHQNSEEGRNASYSRYL